MAVRVRGTVVVSRTKNRCGGVLVIKDSVVVERPITKKQVRNTIIGGESRRRRCWFRRLLFSLGAIVSEFPIDDYPTVAMSVVLRLPLCLLNTRFFKFFTVVALMGGDTSVLL